MSKALKAKGNLLEVNGHKIHIYSQGDKNAPAIVLEKRNYPLCKFIGKIE